MPQLSSIMRILKIVIVVLAVLLLVLVFFFVRQSILLRRERILSAHELWMANSLKDHGQPTQADVASIAPWMTFDYVNQLFHIPAGYLQEQLSISDSHYPHMTISSYAHHHDLSVTTLLANLDDALTKYLTNATSTPLHA